MCIWNRPFFFLLGPFVLTNVVTCNTSGSSVFSTDIVRISKFFGSHFRDNVPKSLIVPIVYGFILFLIFTKCTNSLAMTNANAVWHKKKETLTQWSQRWMDAPSALYFWRCVNRFFSFCMCLFIWWSRHSTWYSYCCINVSLTNEDKCINLFQKLNLNSAFQWIIYYDWKEENSFFSCWA